MTAPTLLLVLLLGAARAQEPAGATAAPPAPAAGYVVGHGDVLKVQVYGEADLSRSVPVDEGGRIDFPFLGPVAVEGLTADQVATTLRTRLQQGYLVDPQITVWVESYGSQPVQVLGAVGKPGVYYIRGPTTLLELLGQAGGVNRQGVNEVRLTRAGGDGGVTVLPFEDLVSRGVGNLPLAGGDVVFVPESLVYVSGQVSKPGSVAFREGLTVARAITEAGGAADAANLGRVTLLRGDQRIRVNVRRILKGKDPDVPVLAGDQVVVGESVL
jgi:polysaccharide export outer membrane protein